MGRVMYPMGCIKAIPPLSLNVGACFHTDPVKFLANILKPSKYDFTTYAIDSSMISVSSQSPWSSSLCCHSARWISNFHSHLDNVEQKGSKSLQPLPNFIVQFFYGNRLHGFFRKFQGICFTSLRNPVVLRKDSASAFRHCQISFEKSRIS